MSQEEKSSPWIGGYWVALFSSRGFVNEEVMFTGTIHTQEGGDRKMLKAE